MNKKSREAIDGLIEAVLDKSRFEDETTKEEMELAKKKLESRIQYLETSLTRARVAIRNKYSL